MEQLTISADKRVPGTKGQLAAIRREGRVPGVVYGLKSDPEMLAVKATDLRPILAKRNHIVELQLEGQALKVMVKQVERDPIRRDVLHIDFLRVDEIHPVTVTVPVITEGIPVGVRLQGGVLGIAKKNVKLKAKIRDIPDNFTIDVSDMETGKTFYVRDLKFEKGVFVTPGRTALFGVGTGRKEEEIVAATPAAGAAPAAGAPAAPGVAPAAGAAAPAAGKDKDKGKGKSSK